MNEKYSANNSPQVSHASQHSILKTFDSLDIGDRIYQYCCATMYLLARYIFNECDFSQRILFIEFCSFEKPHEMHEKSVEMHAYCVYIDFTTKYGGYTTIL